MKCGVSNAVPYAHFKNKDEFIGAIAEHALVWYPRARANGLKKRELWKQIKNFEMK